MRINTNATATSAYVNLEAANKSVTSSIEKLSSGFRINRAADDAAGLVISEKLRSQINGTKVAIRNAQDAIGVIQTADGALNEVGNILQRMRDLAMHAGSSATDSAGRAADHAEYTALKNEIDRISSTTKYGTQNLLDGSFGVTGAQVSGYNATSTITTTATDAFTINIDGAGAVSVVLDGGTRSGADFATYLQGEVRAALLASNATNQAFADKVTVTSTTVGAGFAVTLKVDGLANGDTFVLADTVGTPLADISMDGAVTAASGTGGEFVVGSTAAGGDVVAVAIESGTAGEGFSATNLGVNSLDLTTSTGAQAAVASIDSAIGEVTTARGKLGAYQNRFEHTVTNLSNVMDNLSSAESRIRDTDMASEVTAFTKAQILSQAATAMLAQANAAPQSVLSLLR